MQEHNRSNISGLAGLGTLRTLLMISPSNPQTYKYSQQLLDIYLSGADVPQATVFVPEGFAFLP